MPGLFGFITLDAADPPSEAERLLEEMADRLRHRVDYEVDRWHSTDRRRAVWRIGRRFQSKTPWPYVDGPTHAFVDGVLHEDGLSAPLSSLAGSLGCGLAKRLRGSFSCVVCDDGRNEVSLSVDHHASRPLITMTLGGVLYFAPEVKALLAVPGCRRRPDDASIGMLLSSGWLLPNQTMFADLCKLRGGEEIVIGDGRQRLVKYWEYRLSEEGDGTSADQLAAELGQLVLTAVSRNFAQPDNTTILFSGGVDSRAIVAAAHDLVNGCGERIHTVTFAHEPQRRGSDATVVEICARRFGLRHATLERTLSEYGKQFLESHYILDGVSDGAASHPYELGLISRCVNEGRECILRGDECFGWSGSASTYSEARLEVGLRSLAGQTMWSHFLHPAVWNRVVPAMDAALLDVENDLGPHSPNVAKDLLYEGQRLPGLLQPLAYCKMVASDHRNPLLDLRILEFNARVPSKLRLDKSLFRQSCEQMFPHFWGIPTARRSNLVDWAAELRRDSPLRRYLQAELADKTSAVWDWLDRDRLAAMVDGFGTRKAPGVAVRVKSRLVEAAKSVGRIPVLGPALRRRYKKGLVRPEQLCLRALTLKAWCDLFLEGAGARRLFQDRQVAAVD